MCPEQKSYSSLENIETYVKQYGRLNCFDGQSSETKIPFSKNKNL